MTAPPDRLRQLHTLTGVFPVGLFLLGHVVVQLAALDGGGAFERAEVGITAMRLWPALELGVLASLLFHAAYGVRLVMTPTPRSPWYRGRSALHLAQRATGGVAFAFLAWHLVALRLERARGGLSLGSLHPTLVATLSSTTLGVPLAALGYLLGLAACTFHFANGLASFVSASGLGVSRSGRRNLTFACAALGAALFIAGADTTVALATGARHFVR